MEKSSLPGSNFYMSWNTETQPQVLLTTHKERSICGSSCSSPRLCIQPAAPSSTVFFLRTVHKHTEDQRSHQWSFLYVLVQCNKSERPTHKKQLEVGSIELKAAMEGFDWWEETALFGTSDEFTVPDVHPTPPSTALWAMEPISS